MNLKEQQYIVTLAGCGSMTQAEHHTASPILLSGRGGEQPGLSPV